MVLAVIAVEAPLGRLAFGVLAALLAQVVVEALMILAGTLLLPASMGPLFLVARVPKGVLTVLRVLMVPAVMVA